MQRDSMQRIRLFGILLLMALLVCVYTLTSSGRFHIVDEVSLFAVTESLALHKSRVRSPLPIPRSAILRRGISRNRDLASPSQVFVIRATSCSIESTIEKFQARQFSARISPSF